MGCGSSNENDQTAAGATVDENRTYNEQAEDAVAMLSGTGRLYTRLQLSISCKALVNLDTLGKSDPFVVVTLKSPSESQGSVELGRTEIISNNLNPSFVTIVSVAFKFEEIQNLRFEVYDMDESFDSNDASGVDPSKQQFQGAAECALAQIVGGGDQTWEGILAGGPRSPGGAPASKVVVRAEEVANSNALVSLTLGAVYVRNGSKCFLRISRIGETGPPMPCCKTEVAKGSNAWAPIKIPLQILANGDSYRPLLIEVFSWKGSGSHSLLGSCKASVVDLQAKAEGQGEELVLEDGAGRLAVHSCILTSQPSFFDYIAGGMQIGFMVAVDYTGSNGNPSQPGTLHYHDPTGHTLNEYAQAIQSVGGVLEFFDADRRFPVYGFGGKPTEGGPVNHCFAVNGRENDPEVVGVAGVMDLYRESLQRVGLSGPTLFAPVIGQANRIAHAAKEASSNQSYTILLLLTDGAICDMENTIDAIVRAADYPFSIVIVGVGKADFSSMEKLDGDDVRLVNRAGKKASRDIVQFVSMRDVDGKNPEMLAAQVLAEIPGQVIEYTKLNNIVPGHARHPTAPSTPFTPLQICASGGDAPPAYAAI